MNLKMSETSQTETIGKYLDLSLVEISKEKLISRFPELKDICFQVNNYKNGKVLYYCGLEVKIDNGILITTYQKKVDTFVKAVLEKDKEFKEIKAFRQNTWQKWTLIKKEVESKFNNLHQIEFWNIDIQVNSLRIDEQEKSHTIEIYFNPVRNKLNENKPIDTARLTLTIKGLNVTNEEIYLSGGSHTHAIQYITSDNLKQFEEKIKYLKILKEKVTELRKYTQNTYFQQY